MLWGSLSVGTSGNTAALATDAKHGSTENIPKYEWKFMCEKSGRQSLALFPLFSIAFLFFKSLWMAAPSPNQVAPAIHAMPGKPTNANEGPHQAVLIVL
jgi:hypothetical protein